MRLASCAWPDLVATSPTAILAVPLGSTEQHGPHLPLSTDTAIAVALAEGLATARSDVVVAPALCYGSSGEHAGFPGTLSIGQRALELVLVELVRSADAFRGVVVVNAHGGNADPLRRAVSVLAEEGRRVLAWTPSGDGDAHAGRSETSLMLALAPELVRLEAARAGDVRPLVELIDTLHADGVAAVSSSGVLGDPTGASADEGRSLLDRFAAALAGAVHERFPA